MASGERRPRHPAEITVLTWSVILLLCTCGPARALAQSLGACHSADVAAGALIRALGVGASELDLPTESAEVVSHGMTAFRLPQIEATLIHVWDLGSHLPGYLLVARGDKCFQLGGFAFPEVSTLAATLSPVHGIGARKFRGCLLAVLLAPQLVDRWSIPAEGSVPSELILSHCTVEQVSRSAVRGHVLDLVKVRIQQPHGSALMFAVAFDSDGRYVTGAARSLRER